LSSWDTTSVTDLYYTFSNAGAMNSDLGAWKIGKVTTMTDTFYSALNYTGVGLASWDTTSVITLLNAFYGAGKMNSDLSSWKVGKVTSLYGTFYGASEFVGTGLASWDTASVTTLQSTFTLAGEMNSDLSSWKVGKVTSLYGTFSEASKFVGTGLSSWDTTSVTDLYYTFSNAGAMNSDLSSWRVSKVTKMTDTFAMSATSLTSCNKRRIADAWGNISTVFKKPTWENDKCTSCSAAGERLNAGTGGCLKCTVGRFTLGNNSKTECEPCGTGNYTDVPGR
jgi:surface protein